MKFRNPTCMVVRAREMFKPYFWLSWASLSQDKKTSTLWSFSLRNYVQLGSRQNRKSDRNFLTRDQSKTAWYLVNQKKWRKVSLGSMKIWDVHWNCCRSKSSELSTNKKHFNNPGTRARAEWNACLCKSTSNPTGTPRQHQKKSNCLAYLLTLFQSVVSQCPGPTS